MSTKRNQQLPVFNVVKLCILVSMVRQCGLQIANICPVNPSYHASFPSIPQNAGILNWCLSNKVNRNPVKFSSSCDTSLYCMSLLIMGGIEVNPGPGSAKDLCGVCKQVCTWKEKAIACDECDTWYHTSCTGITSMEYSRLANQSGASLISVIKNVTEISYFSFKMLMRSPII